MPLIVSGHIGIPTFAPSKEQCLNPDLMQFIAEKKIPCVNKVPSLLLDGLGTPEFFTEAISRIFLEDGKNMVFLNTPGAGKTRVAFEGLCRHWGFYIICQRDSNKLGSQDITNTIDQWLGRYLEKFPDHNAVFSTNEDIANGRINRLIFARYMLLGAFLKHCQHLPEFATSDGLKKKWLLLQLYPAMLDDKADILLELLDVLQLIPETTILDDLAVAQTRVGLVLGTFSKPLHCVLDEAQYAAAQFREAFKSAQTEQKSLKGKHSSNKKRSSNKKHDPTSPTLRPILRQLMWCLTKQNITCVLMGTALELEVINEAVSSAGGKPRELSTDKMVGAFFDQAVQAAYIKRYFPLSYCESDAGRALLTRAFRWLQGRHRFTAAYVQLALTYGLSNPHQMLDHFIAAMTDIKPTDGRYWSDQEAADTKVRLGVTGQASKPRPKGTKVLQISSGQLPEVFNYDKIKES
ncbi:hypothetical protein C8J56DRAFT_776101 [Mycena floridula]|nr:hypothetical protein C8J56DRAFT_776101 [Mycena floridula]